MSANWGKDAWDQYDRVGSHLDGGIDFVKRMQAFTKDRMKIEADYAKELRKLAKNYSKRKEDDVKYSDVASFYKVVKEVDDVAGQHEIIVENTNTKVHDPLKKLQHDLHKEKKVHMQEGAKQAANYSAALNNLEKAKKKYEDATKVAEAAQMAFDKASQDMNLTRAAVEKNRQFSLQKNDQAEEAKGNYLVCLDQTNQLQREHFFTRMPEVFSNLQRMEEMRVDTIKQHWLSLLDIELAVVPIITKCRDNIRDAANSMDSSKDSVTFVEDHRTGYHPPTDKLFEEYSSNKKMSKRDTVKPAASGPREDFGHLPPAKRKKKLQGKVKEFEDMVKKETSELTALEKMYQVYSANPSLGDPTVVQQQLGVISEKIEALSAELYKFECFLAVAEGKDVPARRSSPGKAAPAQGNNSSAAPPPPPQQQQQQSQATGGGAAQSAPPSYQSQTAPPAVQNQGGAAPPAPPAPSDEGGEFDDEFTDPSFCGVVYDFVGTNEGELSVQIGDKLEVLENDGSGWIHVKKNGQEGYVPYSYVELK